MRILVFTVSAWNSKVGSNTWASLLEGCDPESVANICIRDETPDSPVCSRYFNISENKIIKSIFNRKIKTGREIDRAKADISDNIDLEEHNIRYQKMTVKRRYSMLMARELVWKLGRWKTKELDNFLDSFKPDIILHSMEGYIHLNRITEYAIKRTGARAVGYIWDDNFTYRQFKNPGYRIYRFFQRRSLKRLARKTDNFFAITPKTKKEADRFFGIDCTVLTKPLSSHTPPVPITHAPPFKMLYTGNLLIGRDDSACALVSEMKKLNAEKPLLELDIYTKSVLDEAHTDKITSEFSRIHPPIPQSEVLELQKEADILLFLETLDEQNKTARLSFSTKITDYYSAGKCIFAIGNHDLAPIELFKEKDSAIVVTREEDIAKALLRLCDTETVNRYAQKASEVAKNEHSPEKINGIFTDILKKTLEGNI